MLTTAAPPLALVPVARRPQDVPEMAVDLAQWMASGGARLQLRACYRLDPDIDLRWIDGEARHVTAADAYYVTPDMVDLLAAAAPSYPIDAVIDRPISSHGLMVLGRPLQLWDDATDLLVGCYWRAGVAFALLAQPPLSDRVVTLTPSITLDGPPADRDQWTAPTQQAWRTLAAALTLMAQRIALPAPASIDRSTRRRLARLGIDAPIDVQVIDLRRPAHVNESGDPRPIAWSHRWIVGGHWRSQYMPGSGRHEPRWIAPHVKGPVDRPIVVADRVYRWSR